MTTKANETKATTTRSTLSAAAGMAARFGAQPQGSAAGSIRRWSGSRMLTLSTAEVVALTFVPDDAYSTTGTLVVRRSVETIGAKAEAR